MRRFPLGPALVLLLLIPIPLAAATAGAAASKASAEPAPDPAPDHNSELRLGREAYARGDYANAATHLARAAATFQVTGDREALAGAYLELGRVDLVGLGEPEKALTAFLKSAEIAARPPDALVWAAMAAEKLGLNGEARRYRERALAPPPRPAAEIPAKAAPAREPARAAASPPVPAPPKPPIAAPAAVKPPAPAAEPSAGDTGSAVEHFFAEHHEEAPAPAPDPIPLRNDDAFDHFFGPRAAPAAVAAPAPAAAAPAPKPQEERSRLFGRRKKPRAEKDKELAAEDKAAPAASGEPVGAFDYFFKKKRPAPAPPPKPAAPPAEGSGDKPAEGSEKPPA